MHPSRPCFKLPPLALAVALAFSAPGAVLAQAATDGLNTTTSLSIAAQPLGTALNALSAATGTPIGFSPALVSGKTAEAIQGSLTVRQAVDRLLVGSGLTAEQEGNGFVIKAASSAGDVATLAPVLVKGVTEGTGSYTTNLTNTAAKFDLTLRETPQSVTVMTHKRMEDQGLDEISKVLDQTPGLYFNNTNTVGSDKNVIYSRGFELQNYQVNGIPRSNRFGFKNDIADTAVFDRVEVVRGASGLLNGVGEPSGAVNLVRKLPTRDFQASVAAKYGSWDFYRAEADMSGPLTESGNIRGRLVAAYQDNGTFMDRVKAEKKIFYGIVEADLTPNTILSAGIEYQDHDTTGGGPSNTGPRIFFSDGTLTNFGPSTNLAPDFAYTKRDNLTLFAGLEHYFDNDWKVRLDLEYGKRKYDINNANIGPSIAPDGTTDFFNTKWYGEPEQTTVALHANGPFQFFGRTHDLVLGGSYYRMEEENQTYTRHDGTVNAFDIMRTGYYPEVPLSRTGAGSTTYDHQSGLYAATRLNPMDGVSVILGSRLSNWKTRTDRFNTAGVLTRGETIKESSVISPYAGIVVDVTDFMSVYASYTDIFQPSAFYDANGALLDPAEGTNLEAGVKMAFFEDRLNVSAAVYTTRKDNVPEWVCCGMGPTGQYMYEAVDGTKTNGFELEIAGELTPNWQIAAGYSYSKPVDANGDPRLTYIPRQTLKLFTSYQPRWLLEGLTVGANLRWQGAISTPSPFPYKQESFATLDLMSHYEFNRHLSATLNVNNVFDKRYYTNISGGGWFGEPRSAFVNLRYKF